MGRATEKVVGMKSGRGGLEFSIQDMFSRIKTLTGIM